MCTLGIPSGKEATWPMQEAQFRSLGQEDPLEEEMATHSSILAWRIPWAEEPGGVWATVHGVAESCTQAPTCICHPSMYTSVIFRTLKTGMKVGRLRIFIMSDF